MGAQCRPEPLHRALAQEVFVHLAQHRAKAEGIFPFPLPAAALGPQPIVRLSGKGCGEKSTWMNRLRRYRLAALAGQQPELLGARGKDGYNPAPVAPLRSQHGKRITMPAASDGLGDAGVNQLFF